MLLKNNLKKTFIILFLLLVPFFQENKGQIALAAESNDLVSLFEGMPIEEFKKPENMYRFLYSVFINNPQLITSSLDYSVDLTKIIADEIALLEILQKKHPEFMKEWEKKKFHKITIHKSRDIQEATELISEEMITNWREQNLQILSELSTQSDTITISRLQDEISQIDSFDINGFYNGLILSLPKDKQGRARTLSTTLLTQSTSAPDSLANYLWLHLPDDLPKFQTDLSLQKTKKELLNYIQHKTQRIQRIHSLINLFLVSNEYSTQEFNSLEKVLTSINGNEVHQLMKKDFSDLLTPNFSSQSIKSYKTFQTHFLKLQTEMTKNSQYQKTLSLVEQSPLYAILRGCSANDCSSSHSFPYPNAPSERVFFIYDENDQNLLGYISSMITKNKNEPTKKILYVSTIAGKSLTSSQTEDILNALYFIKHDLGVDEINIPTINNINYLINYAPIKSYLLNYIQSESEEKLLNEILHLDSVIRSSIENYSSIYNNGLYDHRSKNGHSLTFRPFSLKQKSEGMIQREYLVTQEIIPRSQMHQSQSKNLSIINLLDGITFFAKKSEEVANYLVKELTGKKEAQEVTKRLMVPKHKPPYIDYEKLHQDIEKFFQYFKVTHQEKNSILGRFFSQRAMEFSPEKIDSLFLDFQRNILIQYLTYQKKFTTNILQFIDYAPLKLEKDLEFKKIIDSLQKSLKINQNVLVSADKAVNLYIAFLDPQTAQLQEKKMIAFLQHQITQHSNFQLISQYLTSKYSKELSFFKSQDFFDFLIDSTQLISKKVDLSEITRMTFIASILRSSLLEHIENKTKVIPIINNFSLKFIDNMLNLNNSTAEIDRALQLITESHHEEAFFSRLIDQFSLSPAIYSSHVNPIIFHKLDHPSVLNLIKSNPDYFSNFLNSKSSINNIWYHNWSIEQMIHFVNTFSSHAILESFVKSHIFSTLLLKYFASDPHRVIDLISLLATSEINGTKNLKLTIHCLKFLSNYSTPSVSSKQRLHLIIIDLITNSLETNDLEYLRDLQKFLENYLEKDFHPEIHELSKKVTKTLTQDCVVQGLSKI